MRAEPRVLVTRPAGQAEALIGALSSQGFAVLHLPMLSLEPIDPLPAEQRQRLLDLDQYTHVIFISSNAARFGLEHFDRLWPQYPTGLSYWAVGDSTARVLEDAGLAVSRPGEDMSTEGLLAMPGLSRVQGQKILIVKGEGGREVLRDRLSQRGARVDALSCYRRSPSPLDGAECRDRLQREPVQLILISSGEGLAQLTTLLRPEENTKLASVTLVAPSERVAAQARQLGWHDVRCSSNASDESMVAAATRWQSEQQASRPRGEKYE